MNAVDIFEQYEPFDPYRMGTVVGFMQSAIDVQRLEIQDLTEHVAFLQSLLDAYISMIGERDAEIERLMAERGL